MPRLRTLLSLMILVSTVVFAAPIPAASANGVDAALSWLRGQQQTDGGFSNGFAAGSDIGATSDAVIAIASVGESPNDWRSGGRSPLEFLRQHAMEVTSPGLAAKVALAVVAAEEDPRNFGGVDLIEVANAFDETAPASAYDRALAILALRAGGAPVPPEAVSALVEARLPDGSYAFDASLIPGSGDSNTTALVVQALLSAGRGEETLPSYAYFRDTQNDDGGWTYQKPSSFGEATDANSTALVVQALLAGGQDLADWEDPQRALLGLQQPSGALAFNAETPGDNLLATVQAIPALAGIDLTDVSRLAHGSGAPNPAAVFAGAAILLVSVLLVVGILSRAERSR